MNAAEHSPIGFFLLRTPLLPLATVQPTGVDARSRISAGFDESELRRLAALDHIVEAIMVAAPAFASVLQQWLAGTRSDDDKRIRKSFVNYLYRMSWRATPYGLFAGTTVGFVEDRTDLRIKGVQSYRKKMHVDFGVMSLAADLVGRDVASASNVSLRANSSAYCLAGQFRFVEKRVYGTAGVTYTLASVDWESYIAEIVEEARDTRSLGELTELLVKRGASEEDARAFILDMTAADLLQVACDPPLVSDDHLSAWRLRLTDGPESFHSLSASLAGIDASIQEVNSVPLGAELDKTRQLIQLIRELPGAKDHSYLVDARLLKPAERLTLGPLVMSAVQLGMRGLSIAAAQRSPGAAYVPGDLRTFMDRFQERYGDEAVPFCEALDAENGLGFPGAWEPEILARPPAGDRSARVGNWADQLRRAVWNVARRGETELALSEVGWEETDTFASSLPDSMLVYGRLAALSSEAVDAGKFLVYLMSVAGPSAVAQLGRFCVADEQLAALVKKQILLEQASRPEVVFAEVAHLGGGRVGNLTIRPRLTEFEIDYLGGSNALGHNRILASDLMLSVRGGRVVLRSVRLNREVIPRLSSAHATFQLKHLPIYRFLSAIKAQNMELDISWNWGPLEGSPFLPRVTHGPAVLALARWAVSERDLKSLLLDRPAAASDHLHCLRQRMGIPDTFCISEDTTELLVDSGSNAGVEFFLEQAKKHHKLTLLEQFPLTNDLCAVGPEGHFVSEFMLPVMRSPSRHSIKVEPHVASGFLQHMPGADWMYVKLYAGWATIDRLLLEVVAPLIQQHRSSIERWFFIRYGDPDPHIRVRFHGNRRELLDSILLDLHTRCEPWLRNRALASMQLDTYAPEIPRYGGPGGTEVAERLFCVDSDAAIESMVSLVSLSDEMGRRIATAQSADQLLRQLLGSNDPKLCLDFAAMARDHLLGALHSTGVARKAALRESSVSFRTFRALIELKLSEGIATSGESCHLNAIAHEYRDLALSGALTTPFESIVESCVHMHCNRRFRLAHRSQELTVYDWLARYHSGRLARGR